MHLARFIINHLLISHLRSVEDVMHNGKKTNASRKYTKVGMIRSCR